MLGGGTLQRGGAPVAGPPCCASLVEPAIKVLRHEAQRTAGTADAH